MKKLKQEPLAIKKINSRDLFNSVHVGDSRILALSLPDESINLTITSPPYFDLKDYGPKGQIGFGQNYEEYLEDLKKLFTEVHRATKADGSLWLVVDTFRRDQEVFPLPFDIAAKLKICGWSLRDIIIWKKERTVPWVAPGATRKIFEYILVLTKGTASFKYDPTKYRQTTDLKRWWVRYPERYNPKGKAPEEIWSYDIPTQGSWGASYVSHFCPLPSELVARIIQLTTAEGDVVLDPFSGSGTVPTVSRLLGRTYVGFELNPKYVEMFKKHLANELQKKTQQALDFAEEPTQGDFEKTIVSLRVLKYGRLLLRKLKDILPDEHFQVFVYSIAKKPEKKFKYYAAEYVVLLKQKKLHAVARSAIEAIIDKPPLSKFGIEPKIVFANSATDFTEKRKKQKYFSYTYSNSHRHAGALRFDEVGDSKNQLFSPIELSVEEPDV